MAAYTSTQTGNWSSTSTWGGSGPPGNGDTASIGAHTVTVDVNTTVGTSPNDITTIVLDRTSGSSKLIVAAGITLTVKGNIGGVGGTELVMEAGSTIVFDASGSGGSPVYTFITGGWDEWNFNGTANSKCEIRSVNSSYTWQLTNYAAALNGIYYTNFVRAKKFQLTNTSLGSVSGSIVVGCTWDTGGDSSTPVFDITQSSGTLNLTFTDNVLINSANTAEGGKLICGTARSSGTRIVSRNVFDTKMTDFVLDKIFDNNILGDYTTIATLATFYRKPRNNMLIKASGAGSTMVESWDGIYFVSAFSAGNPHYIDARVARSADETYRRVIFENQSADLVDTGDCFLLGSTFCTSGYKLIVKNCIALRSPSTGVQAGQLITSINPPATAATHKVEVYHNTVNQNKTSAGGVGLRAAIAFAESATGAADQIAALKSNLVWATATGNGYLAERISGTVDGHITAANADYNWLYNIDAGGCGRGYRDRANSPEQDLWAVGNADGSDASAAGADNNQQSGDPQFLDNTRCIATWCSARGYGAATYAAGITALKADPTRIGDLINYVFEGFKVQTSGARTAHDGAAFGAANFHDTTRSLSVITSRNTSIETAYAASFATGA
jgi:hypothetical protein